MEKVHAIDKNYEHLDGVMGTKVVIAEYPELNLMVHKTPFADWEEGDGYSITEQITGARICYCESPDQAEQEVRKIIEKHGI